MAATIDALQSPGGVVDALCCCEAEAVNLPIIVISSMATRALLAELTADYQRQAGIEVLLESVGGVEAEKRLRAGEAFDLAVLAADAIERLISDGRVLIEGRINLAHSQVAVAVPAGAKRPDIGSEAALRSALLAAERIGYSTGPSGKQLLQLFKRWGLAEALRGKLVQAPAGVPVGALLARDEVSLGFQQFSELMHVDGIQVLGTMPDAAQINTTFSAGCCALSTQPQAVRALLDFLRSPAAEAAKRRHGMTPG